MGEIKKIQVVRGIGDTPARVSRKLGLLQINADKWDGINDEEKPFILLHEKGHVTLNTSNEFSADKFAYHEFLRKGGSKKTAVKALLSNLNIDNPAHKARVISLLQMALLDEGKNGNNKAYNQYLTNKSFMNTNNNFTPVASLFSSFNEANEYDNILGIGKKSKERKAQRVAIRNEKKASKIEARKAKSSARLTLADKGINMAGGFTDALKNVAGIVTGNPLAPQSDAIALPPLAINTSSPVQGMLSGGVEAVVGNPITSSPIYKASEKDFDKNEMFEPLPPNPNNENKKNNTTVIAIIVVIVVMIIILFKK